MPKGSSSPWGLVTSDGVADGGAEVVGHVFAEDDGRHGGDALCDGCEGDRGNLILVAAAGCAGESPAPTLWLRWAASSSGAADPSFTEVNRSPTLRSYLGIMPLRTAPRARGPREIRTCSKMAGAAATTWGCLERRSMSAGQSLMPSSAMRCRLMCDVEPSRRCCRSWRNPLVMAMATTSEATPAATPAMEMPVMMPMKACRRLARR